MRVSELTTTNIETRRVGVRFPSRDGLMSAAVRLLLERNIDCHVGDDDPSDPRRYEIWVDEIELNAPYVMGAIERALGVMAFNEWER